MHGILVLLCCCLCCKMKFQRLFVAFIITSVIEIGLATAEPGCFQVQYVQDKLFAKSFSFGNVSDVVVNERDQHVLVLQRSHPPVSVWSNNGTLLFAWETQEIGFPHSLTLNQTGVETTVWITDMAGELAAGKVFGHCAKQFTYTGKFIRSIGTCSSNSSGSGLNPVQFDRVTDMAINSMGNIFIADGDIGGKNNRVLVFDQSYKLVNIWNKENKPGSGPLEFNLPHSIEIDSCDRVWIADTQNHRIQIVSSDGTFIQEWKCFEDSLVYGLDLEIEAGLVFVTIRNSKQIPEILVISSQLNDCSQIETCSIDRRLVIKDDSKELHNSASTPSSMLHSVAMDSSTGSLYLSVLPGATPPLKFSPAPLPPTYNNALCSKFKQPPLLPKVWNATVLLTPFINSDLHVASIEFSDDLRAMHIILYDINGLPFKEILNIKNETYSLARSDKGITCSNPQNVGWVTPPRDWYSSYECECKGDVNISAIETLAWSCSKFELRDWYWTHLNNGSIWRIFLNNVTNPTRLPVIGDYTVANFVSYGDEIKGLEAAYEACVKSSEKSVRNPESTPSQKNDIFMRECSNVTTLPNWPNFFHVTATFIPVVLNNANLLPTQVIYDWEIESQRTVMCEPSLTYNAYLIHNKTYILNEYLDTNKVKCLQMLPFGPPQPSWMTTDKCECKGVLDDQVFPSVSGNIVIVVCPVAEERVFWTWFTYESEFTPLVFFETETPPDEGTGLAFGDYHSIYQGVILIDLNDFVVPSNCL